MAEPAEHVPPRERAEAGSVLPADAPRSARVDKTTAVAGTGRGDRGRVAVLDIGSNTVRLVVYEAPIRLPIPIFNERAQCALGRNLGRSGTLHPEGVAEALRCLARFTRLSEAMDVAHLEIVATAAVRDASDGARFVAMVEDVAGRPVHVLSGAEEARLAAVGLLQGVPGADGVLGDLGGGSLDLAFLKTGEIAGFATLPAGHLRLAEDSGGEPKAARALVDDRLKGIPWLADVGGRTLYAVGGSWRALARIFIEQTHHPIHILDNYTIPFFDALKLATLIAGLSGPTLEGLAQVAQRRIDTLPFAAVALAALLEAARPAHVVFSANGMREGQMLELIPPDLRQQDPLISACESHAERTGRFAMHGEEILAWMTPLCAGQRDRDRRLRLAACLLSDIAWMDHPDYRAEHAFLRGLRIPYPGLSHGDRAFLAIALFVRYDGDLADVPIPSVRRLLGDGAMDRAVLLGLSLRLAHTLSGGAPGLLSQTRLKVDRERVCLDLPADKAVFLSEAVDRRFRALARHMGLRPRID